MSPWALLAIMAGALILICIVIAETAMVRSGRISEHERRRGGM
jgi:hypothetical protein